MRTLGCPTTYKIALTARGGRKILTNGVLDAEATDLTWGRSLDAISDAEVTVIKRQASAACCGVVAAAEPYQHELTIWRDGQIVWSGPVTGEPTETRTTLTVPARDVLEWLNSRWLRNSYKGDYRLDTFVRQVATNALSPNDPNVLPYLRVDSNSTEVERDIKARTQTAWETISDVLDQGVNATTIGRRIVFSNASTDARRQPQGRLSDGDFAESLRTYRDGNNACTAVAAVGAGDVVGLSEGPTSAVTAYGRVERVIHDTQLKKASSLKRWASAVRKRNYPARTVLVVPSGATLRHTAPVGINDLVCGRLLDVSLDPALWCRVVSQRFRIASVAVSYVEGVERVRVGLDAPWLEGEVE